MATDTVHDPVCHMDIAPTATSGISEYGGKTYSFCSPGCKTDFDANPDAVLQAEAVHHAQPKNLAPQSTERPWWKFWAR
jgi:YHS domain-containing protein